MVADITVVGVKGFTTGVSNTDGTYNINVRGMTAPFVIKAKAANANILYSTAQNGQIQANVTPLNSYIIHQIAIKNGLLGCSWQI